MTKSKLIICSGDSYTAGDEIMDHVFMNVSFEECNKIKRQYIQHGKTLDAKSKFKNDYNIWTADKELNRNHSWAAYLAKHLDLPFVNRAVNGSSIDQIYFSIQSDLLNSSILETDLVLVGLTTPFRIVDFRDPEMLKTLRPNNLDATNAENKLFVELFNDDFALFHYFKTVESLHNLNSKITIRLQPISLGISPTSFSFKYKLNHTRSYINNVWKNSNTSIVLPDEYLRIQMINRQLKVCEYGHAPVESHIVLAEKMYNQLKL